MRRNDSLSLQDSCIRDLAEIGSINFTHREIDVMACLVSARRTSKIASLLSVAPSTVTTHIRNIMQKIGCNSQEGIIDFVEKSQKLRLLKKYYTNLVINESFEKSLKTCALIKKEVVPHLIVYCKDQKQKQLLAHFLKAHLKLSNIEAEVHTGPIHPSACQGETKSQIYLFLKGQDDSLRNSKEFCTFGILDVSDQSNYYYSIFEILQVLLPSINLSHSISEFKTVYEAMKKLNERSEFRSITDNTHINQQNPSFFGGNLFNEELNTENRSSFIWHLRSKLLYLILGLFVMGLIGSNFLIFYAGTQNKPIQKFKENTQLESALLYSNGALPTESILLRRSELLDAIDAKFKQKNALQIIALVGPGGSGKTTLARQYVHEQKANVVWEMNAENTESLKTSYEDLAEALAQEESDKKILQALKESDKIDEREEKLTQFVRGKLIHCPNWILIYDNFVEITDIIKYLSKDLKQWGSGKILLTTRNENIQNNTYVDSIITVGPLTPAQKYDLFYKILKRGEKIAYNSSQQEEIKAFLEEIPPFPLDVSIAAHYIKSTNASYNQYLKSSLQNNRNFVTLQENLLKEAGDYIDTRYCIITAALQQIMKASKDFRDLLLLVSVIDSQNIPRDLLSNYKDSDTVDRFIHYLKRYSLLINQPLVLPSQYATLSFHRNTHSILLSFLRKVLRLGKNAHSISSISDILEQYAKVAIEREDLLQMRNIKPHLKAFLSHEDLVNDSIKGIIEIELGCIYYYTHYQETAKKFLESGISRLNFYPCKENYSRIAQALSFLGNMHKEIGEHKKARYLLEKSILLYKKYDPQNHVGMMRALATLGDTYKNLGDLQKAKDSLIKSLSLSNKHQDANQLEVARTMLYLGIVYRDLGEYEKSIPLLKNSLILFKKYENHIELARALKYLGNTYRNLGRYEEARSLLEQSVFVCRQYLPENQIALGRSLVHLATIYKNLGEYEKAKNLLNESLQIHQGVFGKDSVRTAWVVVLLANIRREMGEYKEAEESIKSCLKTYLKAYGEDSLRTSWVFMQLSLVYEDLKNYKEAQEILEKALILHKKHFKEDHLKIAHLSFYLGNAYKGLGQYEKAQDLLVKSLKIYERHYGKDHIETARILGSLGHLHVCKGSLDEADTMLSQSLQILERSQQPVQFLIYENLAELHLRKVKIEKNKGRTVEAKIFKTQAINELKQALIMVQAHFPEHSAHRKRISATLNLVMNSSN